MVDAMERAARLAALGHAPPGDPAERARAEEELAAGVHDEDGRVRAAALGALARLGSDSLGDAWRRALADPDARVRRRAADLAPALQDEHERSSVTRALLTLLDDADVTVVVAASWALGELGSDAITAGAVSALASVATGHDDALVREAAVAALGALGHEEGLAAILTACTDKPPVRRRAVLALAPFEGQEVEAALTRALNDRDWQTRQAAEDLLRPA
jgi:HEAT repeat protein